MSAWALLNEKVQVSKLTCLILRVLFNKRYIFVNFTASVSFDEMYSTYEETIFRFVHDPGLPKI